MVFLEKLEGCIALEVNMKPKKGFILLLVCIAILVIMLANMLSAETPSVYSRLQQVSGLDGLVVW